MTENLWKKAEAWKKIIRNYDQFGLFYRDK